MDFRDEYILREMQRFGADAKPPVVPSLERDCDCLDDLQKMAAGGGGRHVLMPFEQFIGLLSANAGLYRENRRLRLIAGVLAVGCVLLLVARVVGR